MTLLAGLALALALLAGAMAWRERRRARRLARELRLALDHGRRAADAGDTFFDLATHELRSPLAAILGYQELLEDGAYGSLSEPGSEAIARIGRSARHLLHLIDGVIELGRIRTVGLQPEVAPVDLNTVFRSLAESFRTHTRDRGLDGQVTLPEALPVIRSDQTRLVRALDLVMTSAVKHPAGQELALSVEAAHGVVRLSLQPTRFELTPGLDDRDARLGIRLAVAEHLAALLGGELRLDDDDDGTVHALHFSIRDLSALPAAGL